MKEDIKNDILYLCSKISFLQKICVNYKETKSVKDFRVKSGHNLVDGTIFVTMDGIPMEIKNFHIKTIGYDHIFSKSVRSTPEQSINEIPYEENSYKIKRLSPSSSYGDYYKKPIDSSRSSISEITRISTSSPKPKRKKNLYKDINNPIIRKSNITIDFQLKMILDNFYIYKCDCYDFLLPSNNDFYEKNQKWRVHSFKLIPNETLTPLDLIEYIKFLNKYNTVETLKLIQKINPHLIKENIQSNEIPEVYMFFSNYLIMEIFEEVYL